MGALPKKKVSRMHRGHRRHHLAITLPTLVMGPTATSLSSQILSGWNVEQLDKLSWLFSRPVYRPKRLSASVPDDTLVIGFRIESAQLEPITVERAGGAADAGNRLRGPVTGLGRGI